MSYNCTALVFDETWWWQEAIMSISSILRAALYETSYEFTYNISPFGNACTPFVTLQATMQLFINTYQLFELVQYGTVKLGELHTNQHNHFFLKINVYMNITALGVNPILADAFAPKVTRPSVRHGIGCAGQTTCIVVPELMLIIKDMNQNVFCNL